MPMGDSLIAAVQGGWSSVAGSIGWVDALLGTVLLLSVIVGLMRGFLFEVLSVAGWFAAYFAAQWLAPSLAPMLPIGAPGSPLNHGIAFAAGFVACLLIWSLVSRLVRVVVQATPLSGPDRLLGAGFGLLRGAVILLAVATLVGLTPFAEAPAWRQSHASGWLAIAIEGLKPLLPDELARFWSTLPCNPRIGPCAASSA
jgi:membrane protein required for colicin V production